MFPHCDRPPYLYFIRYFTTGSCIFDNWQYLFNEITTNFLYNFPMMHLKLMRIEKGLTQEQLGKRVGVTQQYISDVESGDISGLTLGKAQKIAKVFNVCEIEFIAMLLNHDCKKICVLWKEDG